MRGSACPPSRPRLLLAIALVALPTIAAAEPPRSVRGEVIEIEDYLVPPVPPKPKQDPRRTPPYSDKAILSDAWAKAWLLLHVDEHGRVRRLKLLKRPGFDLDDIAIREAFARTFEPARDHAGKPIATIVVLGLEWPSQRWMIARLGTAARDCSRPDLTRASAVPWLYPRR